MAALPRLLAPHETIDGRQRGSRGGLGTVSCPLTDLPPACAPWPRPRPYWEAACSRSYHGRQAPPSFAEGS
jgi:hypothetical protein